MADAIGALLRELGEKSVFLNEPMKKHTTFKAGGNADIFVVPETIQQLIFAIQIAKAEKIPYFIMGRGSNLLVRDKGFRGMIIQLYQNFDNISVENHTLVVSAGALLSTISVKALENNLTGLEFASGIPGTLGGAVFMNAGAYDGEMKNVIKSVTALNENHDSVRLTKEQLELGYRKSIFQREALVIFSAELELTVGEHDTIKKEMDRVTALRNEKQPIEMPSAGSTFKRPTGYFTGKLITDSNLKGYSIGGAQVSEKHAGFIINKENATANDIIHLIEYVKKTVYHNFNVLLEPEVRIIGEE